MQPPPSAAEERPSPSPAVRLGPLLAETRQRLPRRALPKGLVWLSRNVQFPDHATSAMIGRIVTLSRQPLPGAPITLELRVQGPSLRAWIEGEPVLAEHDPTFTCGGFGIRCGREQEAAQEVNILCHGYEIRGVAA